MTWQSYLEIFRRRWILVAAILALDVVASGYLFLRSYRHLGYQSCLTLYVADVSSPSMIAAATSTLQSTGQLLAGETAANFFADDILDVAQSRKVADYVSGQLSGRGLPNTAPGDVAGAVSGSRRDRTVDLCVTNPESASALAVTQALGTAMSTHRAVFIGKPMARRTFVSIVSAPTAGVRASVRSQLVNLALRVILGILVALGCALAWDALDPRVRDERDVQRALRAPVLASAP